MKQNFNLFLTKKQNIEMNHIDFNIYITTDVHNGIHYKLRQNTIRERSKLLATFLIHSPGIIFWILYLLLDKIMDFQWPLLAVVRKNLFGIFILF